MCPSASTFPCCYVCGIVCIADSVTFFSVHNTVHTHPFRCVVPGCKFPGGRYQKDLDSHMQEIHDTIINFDFESYFDLESFSAKAPTETVPAVKPHARDQPDHEDVEPITRMYDSSGEAKISPVGKLLGGRVFRIRTFVIPRRSEMHLMLGAECARVLGYRDPYHFFSKNRPLLEILATQQDKDDLIDQEIIPYTHRSRQITLVTAKSIFRQFGSRVIEGGRRVRDDYWEADAVRRGFTEDIPGQIPLRSAKAAGVAGQAEHSQGGPAQHSASFSRKLDTDLFRERQQPSPGKEGRDSRAREATPFGTAGDCPSLSTTNSLAQQSSSVETSTPRQFGVLGQSKNRVDLINLGRVDALGPPSQDYPMVIILSIYSFEQIFLSTCSFCYALRSQSLKLCFSSRLHLFG